MKNYLVNRKGVILSAVVILSFLLRFITTHSEVVYPDSCLYLSYAKSILNGKFTFDFSRGIEKMYPPLYSLFNAGLSYFVGDLALSGVLVSCIAGALLIIPVFYLAKVIYNEKAAWIALVLVM